MDQDKKCSSREDKLDYVETTGSKRKNKRRAMETVAAAAVVSDEQARTQPRQQQQQHQQGFKRERVKKRRIAEWNRGIEDLMKLLSKVNRRNTPASTDGAVNGFDQLLNRWALMKGTSVKEGDESLLLGWATEIVQYTTNALDRLHRENENHRRIIEEITTNREGSTASSATTYETPGSFPAQGSLSSRVTAPNHVSSLSLSHSMSPQAIVFSSTQAGPPTSSERGLRIHNAGSSSSLMLQEQNLQGAATPSLEASTQHHLASTVVPLTGFQQSLPTFSQMELELFRQRQLDQQLLRINVPNSIACSGLKHEQIGEFPAVNHYDSNPSSSFGASLPAKGQLPQLREGSFVQMTNEEIGELQRQDLLQQVAFAASADNTGVVSSALLKQLDTRGSQRQQLMQASSMHSPLQLQQLLLNQQLHGSTNSSLHNRQRVGEEEENAPETETDSRAD